MKDDNSKDRTRRQSSYVSPTKDPNWLEVPRSNSIPHGSPSYEKQRPEKLALVRKFQINDGPVSPLTFDVPDYMMKNFKQIFDMYDKNGDNVINVEELRGILEILGYSPSPEEVERILVKFDQDESGTIDFDEYLCLIQTWIEQDEEQIYEAFKVFDKDGDGFVSAQELKRALTQYGEQFTEEEANEFFNMMDTDGDGVINYEEFVEYLRSMQKYSTE